MKAYKNDLKHMVTNQLEIARKMDRYSTQQTEFETKILTFEIFSDIERSLQQLYGRFSTLENAITFSNLGKMHPSIIDPNYLIEQLNYIQNNIDLRLAFDPNMESIHFWEKAITVKAYGTNETLNFILEVPLVTNNPANLLHLYSIPNDNNTILIPKNPTIILGNNEFAYPHEACVEIMDNDVICKHLEWQALQHSSDCIAQLIQHQEPHNCTYATASYEENIIQQIHENSWIIILKQEEVIKSTCNNEVQYQRSKGISLITIDNNCKVQVAGKTLQTHRKFINIEEIIPLPRAHATPEAAPINIKLQDIKLDKLKDALQRAEKIQENTENIRTIITNNPSWSSVSLYIILSLAAAGYLAYKFWWIPRSRRLSVSQPAQPPEDLHRQPLQPSVRLSLKGGGVMSA